MILRSLLFSLLLTELLEVAFALGWGLRGRVLVLCGLVNLVTNPPVVLLFHLLGGGWLLTAGLELSAILAEWLLYRYSGLLRRPFLFSLSANALSFSLGLMLNQLL